ncbi:hypothetical protein BDA96_10G186500 [Sorghum bicolor]|uniref:Uncharacterized protein n=2 Tax=Sorghum bicolor TaxID=4558 RepID=A0A194YK97_SORBI|nr:hypothetical protein BDA96_10G186500 [Sorghum bicolor]KAG0514382.1 hypothetical protein BDA96_10G186500 [Sorghum bicolor]KXG20010.1 hypothetical protein SORBI_3010G142700 [Sorghum bicolor]KXG20011.1 hypothetical protein SORBI_3010G142700 [Sorghum bicolor]KXG20012.1 hypothetical protein SORBI_3010G142700 [Sorghum bicolor]
MPYLEMIKSTNLQMRGSMVEVELHWIAAYLNLVVCCMAKLYVGCMLYGVNCGLNCILLLDGLIRAVRRGCVYRQVVPYVYRQVDAGVQETPKF